MPHEELSRDLSARDPQSLMSRRDLLTRGLAAGGVVAAASLLAACGGGGATAADTASGAFSDVGGTPKRGGTVILGMSGGGSSDTLDPLQSVSNIDYYRVAALFDNLYYPDTNFVIQPQLAAEAEPNRDGSQWTVRLRSGVEFHNGKTIDADDLAFTMRRIFKVPYSGLVGRFAMVDLNGLKKVDKLTLQVPLKYPFSIFPNALARLPLVPVGFNPNKPVGTGPFMFQSFQAGRQSTFVRNPNWWGGFWGAKGTPYIDALQLVDLPDDTARVNSLLSGQVHGIDQVPLGQANSIKAQGMELFNLPTGNWRPFTMRIDRPPFNDVRVRQAMRLLVDRPQMVEQALAGYGRVANDLYSPDDPAYQSFHVAQREQDLEQARSLLKQAGQSDLRVQLTTSPIQAGIVEASTVLVTQAAQAGVKIALNQVDNDTFFGNNYLKWPFAVDWWPPTAYLDEAVVADGPNSTFNETHWLNPTFSRAYYAALKETDAQKRIPYEHQMMETQYNDGGYIIWGFANTLDAYSPKLRGLIPTKWGQDFSDSEFWRLWLA